MENCITFQLLGRCTFCISFNSCCNVTFLSQESLMVASSTPSSVATTCHGHALPYQFHYGLGPSYDETHSNLQALSVRAFLVIRFRAFFKICAALSQSGSNNVIFTLRFSKIIQHYIQILVIYLKYLIDWNLVHLYICNGVFIDQITS